MAYLHTKNPDLGIFFTFWYGGIWQPCCQKELEFSIIIAMLPNGIFAYQKSRFGHIFHILVWWHLATLLPRIGVIGTARWQQKNPAA
jgi:hypothetical protein